MFSEVLNAVLCCDEQNKTSSTATAFNPQKPDIKLGIIPAGRNFKYLLHLSFNVTTYSPSTVYMYTLIVHSFRSS